MKYQSNPKLTTIKKNYPGNSVKKSLLGKDRFLNEYKTKTKFSLWNMFTNIAKRSKKEKELRREKHTVPVIHLHKLPTKSKDSIVWLGHCSFIITLGKKRILIDPHLSSHPYLKRKIVKPCKARKLKDIDYLCLSHNHRDHLDKLTIKSIKAAKGAKALLPLGVTKYIHRWNKKFKTEEAGWWQQYKTKDIEIYFLPAKHWASRFITDINRTLWGSFLFKTKNKVIFFAGDTAYTSHFKDIHKIFPKIDVTLMPIGAYEPKDIMQSNHMNPEQSVQAFDELQGKTFIPTHYGTFVLSDDSSQVSLSILRKKMKKHKDTKKLLVPAVGEVIYI